MEVWVWFPGEGGEGRAIAGGMVGGEVGRVEGGGGGDGRVEGRGGEGVGGEGGDRDGGGGGSE